MSWPWSYGSCIYNYLRNQCLSLLMLWVRLPLRARITTLCNKVCQWLTTNKQTIRPVVCVSALTWFTGADPGFEVRGAHLKKLLRAEGGVNIFGVFRVKNHEFTPKKSYFFQFNWFNVLYRCSMILSCVSSLLDYTHNAK